MFQYRKILQMHNEDFSLRSIAAATGHSRQKVTEVVEKATERQLSDSLTEEMTDKWLEEFLFPEKAMEGSGYRPMDFEYIHKELAKKNVNLKLLHHEYEVQCRAENAIPYAYRSFLRHYKKFAEKYKATMRIKRKPGEILEVDWAGSTGTIIDRDTGEEVKVYVFVATLPCSQYSYVEGFLSMNLSSWIRAHRNAYNYFDGTTDILVPDNLKVGINKHTPQTLILNPTYKDMANHYHTVVMPARVRTPKDKASVEGSVRVISTWIIAAMRNDRFFTIDEWNEEAARKLEEFNHRDFTKREGSRWSAFLEEEKQYLGPLPPTPYKMSEWLTAKVQPNYHISVKSQFYSVPYEYIGNEIDIKCSDDIIEIYYNRMRIASHKRLYGKYGQQSTLREHMPDNHKLYVDHTAENALSWAQEIGRFTTEVVEIILNNAQAERQGIKAVFNLKKSLRKYSKYELEEACGSVLESTTRPTVSLVQSALKMNKKKIELTKKKRISDLPDNQYGFTRGAAYYGGRSNDE